MTKLIAVNVIGKGSYEESTITSHYKCYIDSKNLHSLIEFNKNSKYRDYIVFLKKIAIDVYLSKDYNNYKYSNYDLTMVDNHHIIGFIDIETQM